MHPALYWIRRDLRLADNPALHAAARSGRAVIPVYIHAPAEAGDWAPGNASNWWLHHSLRAMADALAAHGLPLIIREGDSLGALMDLVAETGAEAVHWNRLYEPARIASDTRVKQGLKAEGIDAHSHNAALLHEPWTIQTGTGGDYKAFTPFWRACRRQPEPAPPLGVPADLATTDGAHGLTGSVVPSAGITAPLDALDLLPPSDSAEGLQSTWRPGEQGAHDRLEGFLEMALAEYREGRERPAVAGTSRLSPHLHHGEISPRQIWQAVQAQLARHGAEGDRLDSAEMFLSEIGWREFAQHVLYHHPEFPDEPLNPRFADFPWQEDPGDQLLGAWQRGETGIPLVDAGMRELYTTGWMHNRIRMVVGSFLVKNLRLPWQAGEAWFWDKLVDADLASNSLGWQWVAGSGADAAPYFRVFNPIRQGERFDAEGAYIAHWLPALAGLPAKHRQAPWQAPAGVLRDAGVTLGVNYSHPLVDLKESRQAALAAFEQIKKGA
ncbi:cryptochrome/photolyase family protein [Spiribacter vilamensis]|uniref:Deoxyribodipyrimidine photo-lyase n=1 Tax=Spiribacter vilamensis TaxID=531306 RepID=A0A4Q8D1J7_9GAMM|nr:deoxyribodipyrimidine photo-lyase [Spiribacter vilamensis]RZU99182.1 deoxyribodipyrimidine photo-lyase [Spiribacter vilamensis]TVO61830.1 deoxyribodipyrimidine photo-lyase [Spiribacter vilamensis]